MELENKQWVLVEYQAKGVVRLVLNNEASFNALSTAMLSAIEAALSKLAQDATCRVETRRDAPRSGGTSGRQR